MSSTTAFTVTALPSATFLSRPRSICAAHRAGSCRVRPRVAVTCKLQDQGNDAPFDVEGAWAALLVMAGNLSTPSAAWAVPDGLKEAFKSKPASLAHPVVMWAIFGSVLYAGWLGWQSRSIRSAEPERRKELVKSKVTKRHFEWASSLAAVMTFFTFSGMANTYTRTGKLFPGPHLFVGLGLVALMSGMAALVPAMQSGKDWARNTHLAMAVGVVGLFGWQAKTGMVIVGKLLGWK